LISDSAGHWIVIVAGWLLPPLSLPTVTEAVLVIVPQLAELDVAVI